MGAGRRDEGAACDLGGVGERGDDVPGDVVEREVTAQGLVTTAPNFWAWMDARVVRSWPEMPVGKPR